MKIKCKKIDKLLLLLPTIIVSVSQVFADVGNTTNYTSEVADSGGILLLIVSFVRSLGLTGMVILIIIVLVALLVIKKMNLVEPITQIIHGVRSGSSSSVNGVMEDSIIAQINKKDEYFDSAQFKGRVSNMYVSLQEAWEKKDWKIARPFETDQLFRAHANMLNEYINKKETNVMDRINIQDVKIVGYSEYPTSGIALIKVQIKVNQVDFIRDDVTGRIVMGNPNRHIHCTYEWELTRKLGVKSNVSNSGIESTCCPSCGAPMSIGAAGSCDYCGATVSTGEYDWVLSQIHKINQR